MPVHVRTASSGSGSSSLKTQAAAARRKNTCLRDDDDDDDLTTTTSSLLVFLEVFLCARFHTPAQPLITYIIRVLVFALMTMTTTSESGSCALSPVQQQQPQGDLNHQSPPPSPPKEPHSLSLSVWYTSSSAHTYISFMHAPRSTHTQRQLAHTRGHHQSPSLTQTCTHNTLVRARSNVRRALMQRRHTRSAPPHKVDRRCFLLMYKHNNNQTTKQEKRRQRKAK